jgi:hypothetical protein
MTLGDEAAQRNTRTDQRSVQPVTPSTAPAKAEEPDSAPSSKEE